MPPERVGRPEPRPSLGVRAGRFWLTWPRRAGSSRSWWRQVSSIAGAELFQPPSAADEGFSVPSDSAAAVLEFARDAGAVISGEVLAVVREAERRRLLVDLATGTVNLDPAGFPPDFLPHQRAGAVYLSTARRAILGDDMGLGKTAQVLAALERLRAFPALVLCPASLERKWLAEVEAWLPHRRAVLVRESKADGDVYVLSYALAQSLVSYSVTVRSRLGTGPPYVMQHLHVSATTSRAAAASALQRLRGSGVGLPPLEDLEVKARPERTTGRLIGRALALAHRCLRAIVCDEAHLLRNRAALRSRTARLLASPVDVRFLLSGSAVVNRVEDLLHLVEILGVASDLFGSIGRLERYLREGESIGASERRRRVLEVRKRMIGRCLIRRRRAEVLPDLPPVRHAVIPVDLTNLDEYRAAETDVVEWLRVQGEHGRAESAERAEAFARLRELGQLSAHGKIRAVCSWLRDFVDGEEGRILLFGHHVAPLLEIGRRLRWPVLYGNTPMRERAEVLDEFAGGRWRGLVAQLEVGGLGLDITAAEHVGFLEPTWRPSDHHQGIARAYGRLSDPHGVTAWWFLGHGTLDEVIMSALDVKSAEAAAAVDGALNGDPVFRLLVDRFLHGRGSCG